MLLDVVLWFKEKTSFDLSDEGGVVDFSNSEDCFDVRELACLEGVKLWLFILILNQSLLKILGYKLNQLDNSSFGRNIKLLIEFKPEDINYRIAEVLEHLNYLLGVGIEHRDLVLLVYFRLCLELLRVTSC